MEKVLVGMSGGVDSSVAAKILIDHGYSVAGVTLKLFSNEDILCAEKEGKTCCALSDVQDARSVAFRLGIDHFVYNFREYFTEKVINHFVQSYLAGNTPNPCIECNRWIKFDKMLERARLLGYEYIATGHYARSEYNPASMRWLLKKGIDPAKDQSYVLYTLTQDQLAHTLFPLGGMDKRQVRSIAEAAGLVNAKKADSQDICFVPGGDYGAFIEKAAPGKVEPGPYVNAEGTVVGTHKGVAHYTIGQRRGIGIALGQAAYVTAKDAKTNTVSLGPNEALMSRSLVAQDVNLIAVDLAEFERLAKPMRVTAKIRYNQKEQDAWISPEGNGRIRVDFDADQRAVTPGQAVVFYSGDIVVGGGTI